MPQQHRNSRTTWLVTRHPGALAWVREQGLAFDRHVSHLDECALVAGDRVIGTLPVPLAADVIARGIQYWHLTLDLPSTARGCELTAEQMRAFGARVEPFAIFRCTRQVISDP